MKKRIEEDDVIYTIDKSSGDKRVSLTAMRDGINFDNVKSM